MFQYFNITTPCKLIRFILKLDYSDVIPMFLGPIFTPSYLNPRTCKNFRIYCFDWWIPFLDEFWGRL